MLKQYRLGGGNINVSAFDQESASRFLGITDISLATTLLQHQLYIAYSQQYMASDKASL